MKKKMWLLILTVIALALLTGCGVKVASEKQMKEDLYNSNEFARFSNELGMEIIDFDVEKRQTSPGDKLDTAWIKISAKSNAVHGEMYYMMLYKLYNDGWLLEQITDDRTDAWRFEPLCGVADETIEHYLPEGAEVLGNQVDLDTAKHTVTYTYTEEHRYCDVVYNRQVIFDFGTAYSPFGTCMPGQWSFGDVVDVGSYEDWDIAGTWVGDVMTKYYGFRSASNYTVKITDFSPRDIAYTQGENGDEFVVLGWYCKTHQSERGSGESLEVWDKTIMENQDGMLYASVRQDENGNIYYLVKAKCEIWRDNHEGTEVVVRDVMRISPDTVEAKKGELNNTYLELERVN